MPPPIPSSMKRMTANPARPVGRYRPGKAVQEENSSDEESEEKEPQPQEQAQPRPRTQSVRPSAANTQPDEEDEDDDEEGFVTDEDDAEPELRPTAKPAPVKNQSTPAVQPSATTRPPIIAATDTNSEERSGDAESEEDDDDSSEEPSSEEEAPQRKFVRPTFIKKSDRQILTSTTTEDPTPLTAASALETNETLRRKAQADLLIKDKLEKDLLARAAGKKAWDDDDELDPEATVDDTDNLDPAAEYQSWVLRELHRVKRDKEAIEASEREIEEKERRRNLTAAEREREDQEFIERQKVERDEGRGAANFMARYHHKGAFFQDDEAAEVLKKRDIMGARFADEVSDKSALPEYMRVRDMTKLGKKGRTRYTDLKGQDTGRFGEEVKRWRGAGDSGVRFGADDKNGGGGDMRGVDERFQPDRDDRGRGPTGANASVVGPRLGASSSSYGRRRRSRSRSRSRSPRRRRNDDSEDEAYNRSRRRSYSRSEARSRSRSPGEDRRKRRHSPDDGRDKRVRIET